MVARPHRVSLGLAYGRNPRLLAACAKNSLVTGACGFIGAHLCRMLRGHGSVVHAVNRRARSDQLDHQWIVDAADMGALRKVFDKVRPDYVFHLASHVSGSRDLSAVMPTFRDNLTTTVNLLTLATEFGCKRIVLAGSLEEAATGERRRSRSRVPLRRGQAELRILCADVPLATGRRLSERASSWCTGQASGISKSLCPM